MSLQLSKLKNFSPRSGPVLLIIMDGVGLGKRDESDGVFLARTPCLVQLMQSPLFTTLKAHGAAVGMPSEEDMGNSEVGHNALGAGRVFAQGAKLVSGVIQSGAIFKTPVWYELLKRVKQNNSTFHLVGLLSDGNVHAHIDHVFVLLKQCHQEGVPKVRLHILLDGRDVPQKSALTYIEKTEALLSRLNASGHVDYRIASGGGRMVTTMDRYNADWRIVERGWQAHVLGQARAFPSAKAAVETYYAEDAKATDQYLNPFVVVDPSGSPVGRIEDGDAVVFFNFRGDRAIEISRAFEEKDFKAFDRVRWPDVLYAGMMQYDGDLLIPKKYLVNPPQIDKSVGEYMCAQKLRSFAVSETQKYGHVTYFWNGNKSGYVDKDLETYVEIPSDKIPFDQTPKMKAFEITEKTVELLKSGRYHFGRINFPNGDMVGHTGVIDAIIASVEAVDQCTARLIEVVNQLRGITVILADHGNADEMFVMKNGQREIKTAHSLNPVPFAIVDSGYHKEYLLADLETRGLSNVAATLLNLLGFEAPGDYDPSLISMV